MTRDQFCWRDGALLRERSRWVENPAYEHGGYWQTYLGCPVCEPSPEPAHVNYYDEHGGES